MSSSIARGFVHKQLVASTSWVIYHGLVDGGKCAVEVFIDVAGELVKAIPSSVSTVGVPGTATITFTTAQSGEAYVI